MISWLKEDRPLNPRMVWWVTFIGLSAGLLDWLQLDLLLWAT
jgi:hypothetical protein